MARTSDVFEPGEVARIDQSTAVMDVDLDVLISAFRVLADRHDDTVSLLTLINRIAKHPGVDHERVVGMLARAVQRLAKSDG